MWSRGFILLLLVASGLAHPGLLSTGKELLSKKLSWLIKGVTGKNQVCEKRQARECPAGFVKCFDEPDLPQHCYKPYECPKIDIDEEGTHNFVIQKIRDAPRTFYGNHIATLGLLAHRYHAVAMFAAKSADCALKIKEATVPDGTFLAMKIEKKQKVIKILTSREEMEAEFRIQSFDISKPGDVITKCLVVRKSSLDIRRFAPLASQGIEYPEEQKYFLYGYKNSVYMSHIATKCPDYSQIIELKERPSSLKRNALSRGQLIYLHDTNGSPTIKDGAIVNPITENAYTFYMERFYWKNFCLQVERSHLFDLGAINAGCPPVK